MAEILESTVEVADGPHASIPATPFSMPEIDTLNGSSVTLQAATRVVLSMRTALKTALDVNDTNPLPVSFTQELAPDAATETTLSLILTALDGLATALASVSTEATQGDVLAELDAIFGAVDGLEGKDYATQTTLALAKTVLDNIYTKLQGSIAVTGTFWQATQPVSGPLTDTQLRATAVPVSSTTLAKESGGNLDTIVTLLTAQALYLDGLETLIGTTNTKLNGGLPAALAANGGLKIEGVASGVAVPVSLASVPSHAVTNAGTFAVQQSKGSKALSAPAPTASATLVLAANASRKEAIIYNDGSLTVYLGKDNTVTTSTGLPLVVGAALTDDSSSDAWWGITASGTGSVKVIEAA